MGNARGDIKKAQHVLITDIGSTTTKALLIGKKSDAYTFLDELEVPTTVEKPTEDVKIGVMESIKRLEEKTGIRITDENGRMAIPYLTTSSAGGGLQMLVFGLHSAETGKLAKMTAYGAGGVILKTFTIDDEIPAIDKMRLIKELHPDMILMAGGLDGGAISGVVRLARLLSLADPEPKFFSDKQIPLVFCGNTDARDFVSRVLEDKFDLYLTSNIRPNAREFNTDPAKKLVHELFMTNVMERAPGYGELKKWVSADIIPTPAGVENILQLYRQKLGKNALMVDMGGATTDIFTNIGGGYQRTVAANIGLSYSISNIMAEVGIEKIKRHLPRGLTENFVRNYISGKMLNPTYVPRFDAEERVEQACAVEGLSWAWKKHLEMNFKLTEIRQRARRRIKKGIDPFQDIFVWGEDEPFTLADIDVIIGAGGILSHTRTPEEAFWMLAEGFKPSGITRIVLDKVFKSPHMGVLSKLDPSLALELFQKECLTELGWVVAPVGKFDERKPALRIEDKVTGRVCDLKWGEVLYLKDGVDVTLIPGKKASLGEKVADRQLKTPLPVLIDCRGRGSDILSRTLSEYGIKELSFGNKEMKTSVRRTAPEIIKGSHTFERRLPYEGEILVRKGQQVNPQDILGENRFHPPRIYIFDVQRFAGYSRPLSEEDFKEGLRVREGDRIQVNQVLFRLKSTSIWKPAVNYISIIRAEVARIDYRAKQIMMKEIQEYDGKPHVVNVAGFLAVRPRNIKSYLRFEKGEFIGYGRIIAPRFGFQGGGLIADDKLTGTLKDIDTKKGTITIQYDLNPVTLNAFVQGEVSKVVEKYSMTISGYGSTLYGIIGFGGEAFGKLNVVETWKDLSTSLKDMVIAGFEPVTADVLEIAAAAGVAGIIAPSVHNAHWVTFYGQEIGVALTGDENIPFVLILTEGFGDFEMNKELAEFLKKSDGKTASISGRTQIRAGVTRPMVFISE